MGLREVPSFLTGPPVPARGLIPAAVLLLCHGSAPAFGWLDAIGDGTLLPGISAGNMMNCGALAAGTGAPSAVLLNPANLGRISSSALEITAGPSVTMEEVDLGSDGSGSREYLSPGPVCAAVRIPVGGGFAAGAGLARLSDGSYRAQRYLYEDPLSPGDITGAEAWESSGGVWEAAAGCSYRLSRLLSIGLSAGPRFGSLHSSYAFDDRTGSDDSTWSQTRVESGFCVHAGATAALGQSSVSASWASGSDMLPARIAAGALVYPGTAGGSYIGAEAELADPGGGDLFTGRVFARFTPAVNTGLSVGFFMADQGPSDLGTNMGLCLGVDFLTGPARLQAAFSWFANSTRSEVFGYEGELNTSDRIGIFGAGVDWVL